MNLSKISESLVGEVEIVKSILNKAEESIKEDKILQGAAFLQAAFSFFETIQAKMAQIIPVIMVLKPNNEGKEDWKAAINSAIAFMKELEILHTNDGTDVKKVSN